MSERHRHKHRCKPIMHYHEHYWRENERPVSQEMPFGMPLSGGCFMPPRIPGCVTPPRMGCDGWDD
jgi:hypothetical protein